MQSGSGYKRHEPGLMSTALYGQLSRKAKFRFARLLSAAS